MYAAMICVGRILIAEKWRYYNNILRLSREGWLFLHSADKHNRWI